MNGSNEPRDPRSASVPIAAQTWARSARCRASFKARAATEVEKAVPLRIPRCSLDSREMGSIPCTANALRDDMILRLPNDAVPSKTRMDGFPMRVPAMYESGERSAREEPIKDRV
jgi:hypothetical protein